jgi:alpha-beta hydrolase superfamily lysophospholipase
MRSIAFVFLILINRPAVFAIEGTWIGEITGDATPLYARLALGQRDGALRGSISFPVGGHDRVILSDLAESGDVVTFRVEWDGKPSSGTIRLNGREASGTIETATGSRTIAMIRILADPEEHFDAFRGTYRAGDRIVAITRSLSGLHYHDVTSGLTGQLARVGESEYIAGPSRDITYPPSMTFHFSADGVRIIEGSGREVSAPRDDGFTRRNVAFASSAIPMGGELKVPMGARCRPAILLLHGSGLQSRFGQHASIETVAQNFVRQGYVVFSFDKRGVGLSSGGKYDEGEQWKDAVEALMVLRVQPEVDPRRVGIWGISQGAILAPRVAAVDGKVAFIIANSGMVTNTQQGEIDRVALQLRADGFPEEEVREAVRLQTLKFQYARTGEGWDDYIAALEKAKDREWLADPYIGPPANKDSEAWALWKTPQSPEVWWRKYRQPMLALFAEHETFGSPVPKQIAALRAAMNAAGNKHPTIAVVAAANHSMLEAKTGGYREMPYLRKYAPNYFGTLNSWLRRNVPATDCRTE